MASIIEFRARTPLEERLAASGSRRASAEVVLFPGVRYERADPGGEEPTPSRNRRSRQRDHLDLDD